MEVVLGRRSSSRTDPPSGRFPPGVDRRLWRRPGTSGRSPWAGSWFPSTGSSSRTRGLVCSSSCKGRLHSWGCPRTLRRGLVRPSRRISSLWLQIRVPCCVSTEVKEGFVLCRSRSKFDVVFGTIIYREVKIIEADVVAHENNSACNGRKYLARKPFYF